MKRAMRASEFLEQLAKDPEYQERARKRRAHLEARSAEWRRAQKPLLEDLAEVGYPISDVWDDLVPRSESYPEAIPVLVSHLVSRAYPSRVMEGIARALAVPESKPYFSQILDVFKDSHTKDVRDGTAAALRVLADSNTVPDLIRIIEDPAYGQDRLMFLDAAYKYGGAYGKRLVRSLIKDPELGEEARHILRGVLTSVIAGSLVGGGEGRRRRR
ncbi:hypothetical protein [Isoptericola aurantiacus]|uniref:hypothetical protein n=1 Tax=Isoptericola aurantiacus TaxID=3377839 RepID=UPI003839DB2A